MILSAFFSTVWTVVLPLIAVFLPGATWLSWKNERHILAWGARVALFSFSFFTLLTYLLAVAHVSVLYAWPIIFLATILGLIIKRKSFFTFATFWYALAILFPVMVAYAAFTIPFLHFENALPTGDAQKAIIWAQQILQTNALPNYQSSITGLNRDPVDFYTPALHTLTAAFMGSSTDPLTVVGLYAIIIAILVALIGAAVAKDIFDIPHDFFPVSLVAVIILTNFRFLRYLKEPGYHLQNVVGEFFLFGMLMLLLSLIHRWRKQDVMLFILAFLSLLLTHQFSAFIGAFMLLPVAGIFLMSRRHIFLDALKKYPWLLLATLASLAVMVAGGFAIGLQKKIPDIFTTHPHLLNSVPALLDYPSLMGTTWLMLGIFGLILLIIHNIRRHQNYREGWALALAAIMILVLSQGPRLGIDIPAVRALLYAVVPFSILGVFALAKLWRAIPQLTPSAPSLAYLTITLIVVSMMWTSVSSAYSTLSHQIPTNSSLSPEELGISSSLATQSPGGVLIDDTNRRSSSWLVLSGQPMFTRITSDIQEQMQESSQSPLRDNIYLNQLNYEKIYSLGSLPLAAQFMASQNIGRVVGVQNSSASAFMHNPVLTFAGAADDFTLFAPKTNQPATAINVNGQNISPWLLKPTTLVNDIGDDEDTFLHLPASIQTARLSKPQISHTTTYRTSTAPYIPLVFNVGDYVQTIWPANHDLQFLISLATSTSNLSLQLPFGRNLPLDSTTSLIRIPAADISIDSNGFITLIINNPHQQPVPIDVVALGLAE